MVIKVGDAPDEGREATDQQGVACNASLEEGLCQKRVGLLLGERVQFGSVQEIG